MSYDLLIPLKLPRKVLGLIAVDPQMPEQGRRYRSADEADLFLVFEKVSGSDQAAVRDMLYLSPVLLRQTDN